MNTTRNVSLALLIGCSAISTSVLAAATEKSTAPSQAMNKDSRMKLWNESRDQLEKELGVGKDKAHYRQTIEKLGYAITAVNVDKPDYLEYEVIKGVESYEVQVDMSNGIAKEVDVTTNIWRADQTKAAMKNKEYRYTYPATVTKNPEIVSDRIRNKAWTEEKATIEKQLGVDQDRAYYGPALEKMGYKVTSVNESDEDTLEMEFVKGDTSYEVEVDFDDKTKKSTKVDVSTNMWETESTREATGKN